MIVAHNLPAMNGLNQLTKNTKSKRSSMEKLSSGFQINWAADDAAGLSISEKMRNQIRGLNQSVKNAEDGISLIKTADGAMGSIHSILERVRELAVKAANDTNASDDRQAIQEEINNVKMVSEVRSYYGAMENRLEHTINNLQNYSENLTNAESTICDTDMATMMTQFSKESILEQAAQAMLSQSSQSTQGVLALIQG